MSCSPWSSSEANEITWSRGRNGKPRREWGNLLLDMFAKATECAASELPRSQYKQRLCGLVGSGGWEPRRSFLLVLHVLKYLLNLFLTSWAWKTLGFAGQKHPSGFCVCGALACTELSKHETWAISWCLRAPEVSPVSSAMQIDVIHFSHFPPKKREKGWTEWGVLLCVQVKRVAKGFWLRLKICVKERTGTSSTGCGPPAWESS